MKTNTLSRWMFGGVMGLLLVAASACTTLKPADPTDTRRLVVHKQIVISTFGFGIKMFLPVGVYLPEMVSEEGTYYRAPSDIVLRNAMTTGGICVPNDPKVEPFVYYDSSGIWTGGRPMTTVPFETPPDYTIEP